MPTCIDCGKHIKSNRLGRKRKRCKECQKTHALIYASDYRKENGEYYREYMREYNKQFKR